jgi:DNA-binding response OmpR family regulator
MERQLTGRVVLVVEDEPLIALDIAQAIEAAGARAISTHSIAAALRAIEDPSVTAAIVDHALGDGDSSQICERLSERNIPHVVYSGFPSIDGVCAEAPHVSKPARPSMLVATVAGLLKGQPISN